MFYNLGPGGDGTLNPNWAMYPQRALVIGEADNTVLSAGSVPLMPAEHMSSSTYNIWNRINFGPEKIASNLGTREFLKRLYNGGQNIVEDDVLGVVTLPRLAVLRGVMLTINTANEGVVFDVISLATGEVLLEGVDASATGAYYVDISGFVVGADTNDILALRIVSWPELEEDEQDPCGVYGPCDDLTLCLTLNAFIWTPVSADFCKSDPCFGVIRRAIKAEGTVVDDREGLTVEDPIVADSEIAAASAANSSAVLDGDTITVTVLDTEGEVFEGATVNFVTNGTVTVDPASGVSGADGTLTTTVDPGESGGDVTVRLAPSGQIIQMIAIPSGG